MGTKEKTFTNPNEKAFHKALLDRLLSGPGKVQNRVAETAGVAPSSVTGWKKGSMPDAYAIYKVAQERGWTTDYLLTGKDGLTDEERHLLERLRTLSTAQRAALLQLADGIRLADSASAPPAFSPHISESLQLTEEEARVMRAWLGRETKTLALEHPLTRAGRKIATLLAPGSVLRALRKDRGKAPSSPHPGEADAPNDEVLEPQDGHPDLGQSPSP